MPGGPRYFRERKIEINWMIGKGEMFFIARTLNGSKQYIFTYSAQPCWIQRKETKIPFSHLVTSL